MGQQKEKLERVAADAQAWAGFAESAIWEKLREHIEKVIIAPSVSAFHEAQIDGKTNEELVRNMVAQRATIKTAKSIIGFVTGHALRLKEAQRELENITKAENKKG